MEPNRVSRGVQQQPIKGLQPERGRVRYQRSG